MAERSVIMAVSYLLCVTRCAVPVSQVRLFPCFEGRFSEHTDCLHFAVQFLVGTGDVRRCSQKSNSHSVFPVAVVDSVLGEAPAVSLRQNVVTDPYSSDSRIAGLLAARWRPAK